MPQPLKTKSPNIATVAMGIGTIDSSTVYPRECIEVALEHNAAAIIVIHNHQGEIATLLRLTFDCRGS